MDITLTVEPAVGVGSANDKKFHTETVTAVVWSGGEKEGAVPMAPTSVNCCQVL